MAGGQARGRAGGRGGRCRLVRRGIRQNAVRADVGCDATPLVRLELVPERLGPERMAFGRAAGSPRLTRGSQQRRTLFTCRRPTRAHGTRRSLDVVCILLCMADVQGWTGETRRTVEHGTFTTLLSRPTGAWEPWPRSLGTPSRDVWQLWPADGRPPPPCARTGSSRDCV